jgi:hypothetical protein
MGHVCDARDLQGRKCDDPQMQTNGIMVKLVIDPEHGARDSFFDLDQSQSRERA